MPSVEFKNAIETLLLHIGEDPNRPGLNKTYLRMETIFTTLYEGYTMDPAIFLAATIANDESIQFGGIVDVQAEVHSTCEHHMMPMTGEAHVFYVPNRVIFNPAKIKMLVKCHSRRLTLPERIAVNIARDLNAVDGIDGTACVVDTTCMCHTEGGLEQSESLSRVMHFEGGLNDPVQKEIIMSMLNA